MPEAPSSKHERAAVSPPGLDGVFASIIAPIQRERENLMLQIAAEEVRAARVLMGRVNARLEAVGVEVPVRTDAVFADDALEVLAGSLGSEIGRRS